MLLVFKRKTESPTESLVKVMSGSMVHVDMIPLPCTNTDDLEYSHYDMNVDDSTKSAQDISAQPLYSYTSYMSETFSRNEAQNAYAADTHVALYANLNDAQRKRAMSYLEKCVEMNIPYNYADMVLCLVPFRPLLIKDISQTDTPPDRLFCSQAAILCLRHALASIEEDPSGSENHPSTISYEDVDVDLTTDDERLQQENMNALRKTVQQLHSRTTTPTTLFSALLPFTKKIEFNDFEKKQIEARSIDI